MIFEVKVKSTSKSENYWIIRQDQIACLTSPVRTDIVDHLATRGPLSIREVAEEIGKQPSAIYHHIRKLEEVELLSEVGSRLVNRRTEKLYATPARRMRMIRALGDPDNAGLMGYMVAALARQAERDFRTGLDHSARKTEGPQRNLGFFRLVNRPSRQSLKEINRKLDEIAEILWQDQDPNAPLMVLSWTMAPLDPE